MSSLRRLLLLLLQVIISILTISFQYDLPTNGLALLKRHNSGLPHLLIRPSKETATPSGTTSLSNTEKFLQKILPSQLIRRSHRQRQKNHSVSSLPDHQPTPITCSAPASPKLSAQSATPLSSRSSNDDRRLQRLLPLPPLPALQSSESLPATNRPILGNMTPSSDIGSSPQRSAHRGRSSTVSSVSSDIAPQMTPSRSRRTNAHF